MIGQKNLIQTIQEQLRNNKFPQFAILVGAKGSGKKTLLKECGLNDYVVQDVKVDTIRKLIDDAYVLNNRIFVIPDADNMSINAKNSLLKVVEEPPNNNRFIMTLEDENNTLTTIKSRAVIYRMEEYTTEELKEYINKYYLLTSVEEERQIAEDLCDTPGEIDLLMSMNCIYFYDYVEKVVDNIATVSGSNSFKIANEIALKNEEDKYDLLLFWKAFNKICIDRFKDAERDVVLKYAKSIKRTSESIRDLKITGINKQALFDVWILGIREAWAE